VISTRLLLVSSALAGSGWILPASAPVDQSDIEALIARVGERVTAYLPAGAAAHLHRALHRCQKIRMAERIRESIRQLRAQPRPTTPGPPKP
jgi:hypothetical protein